MKARLKPPRRPRVRRRMRYGSAFNYLRYRNKKMFVHPPNCSKFFAWKRALTNFFVKKKNRSKTQIKKARKKWRRRGRKVLMEEDDDFGGSSGKTTHSHGFARRLMGLFSRSWWIYHCSVLADVDLSYAILTFRSITTSLHNVPFLDF